MNLLNYDFNITDFYDTVDVHDGLNPALRALFFTWKEMQQDDRYKNSLRWLKDAIGVSEKEVEAIYDLLVNTTWPRVDLPFVDGLGNFGFPPAAPCFSLMKLSGFGKTMVERADKRDINLPFTVPVPYTLVCGSLGYSKGETKMPTHNLAEVIDAMIALIKNPELETEDLLQFIKGPDLLIGGAIENPEELCSIYEKGFGTVKVVVTSQNLNRRWFDAAGNYSNWYELKSRKVYKQEARRIEIPYYAYMSDGEKSELMPLKKILKKQLDYYRAYRSDLDDNELCDVLKALKENSSERKTFEIKR